MTYVVEVLHNEDGPVILARAETSAGAFELAADEAMNSDLVVTDAESDIHIDWIRATPCRQDGHEIPGGFEWCDGGKRCHYDYGKPGPGAFQGAFVSVRYLQRGERAFTHFPPESDMDDRAAEDNGIIG